MMRWLTGPLLHYGSFTGRTGRSEFWLFTLFFAAISGAARWIDGMDGERVPIAAGMGIYELAVFLALLLPFITCGARRLHDTGRSGWWLMLLYVPYLGWIAARDNAQLMIASAGGLLVGSIALIVLLAMPGNEGSNRFGPPPGREL